MHSSTLIFEVVLALIVFSSSSVISLQYTGENLGQADKTELDPGLEELLDRAHATKTWTDKIISQTEVLLQPNPGEKNRPVYLFSECFQVLKRRRSLKSFLGILFLCRPIPYVHHTFQ